MVAGDVTGINGGMAEFGLPIFQTEAPLFGFRPNFRFLGDGILSSGIVLALGDGGRSIFLGGTLQRGSGLSVAIGGSLGSCTLVTSLLACGCEAPSTLKRVRSLGSWALLWCVLSISIRPVKYPH